MQKGLPWKWERQQNKAFEEVKQLLTEVPVLGHYDPEKPLTLATDASPYVIGAVLSHSMPDGIEKPIAYAFQSLNKVKRRYSQLDKETPRICHCVRSQVTPVLSQQLKSMASAQQQR